MTPCENLGYKVGDVFKICAEGDEYYYRRVIVLDEDDGSYYPYFLSPNHNHRISYGLDHLKKIENIPPKIVKHGPGESFSIPPSTNKYVRNIHGVEVDVYDVLKAWNVTCPAIQHAIKKLLMPGQRGHKSKADDLEEAHNAVQRAIELEVF